MNQTRKEAQPTEESGLGREDDTIVALATAAGEGAVAIVRLSGPNSLHIADAVFACRGQKPSKCPTKTVAFGRIRDECGAVVDEALMLIMRGPGSFTGEDVVEFQCHGGHFPSSRIIALLIRHGARPADPGEFTKRAFLHGRIDILQAESIMDLVRAQSEKSAAQAVEQMEGRLSHEVNGIYDQLLRVETEIAATLDFSEEDIPQPIMEECITGINSALFNLDRLLQTWQEGRMLRDGFRVVIMGRPNAGKSSIFNLLVGADRAIVSRHAGTTRDTIEETVQMEGYPIRLVDTAGLRASECEIEQEGIRRARRQQTTADMILYVVPACDPPHPDDRAEWEQLKSARLRLVLNHADRGNVHPDYTNIHIEKTLSIATQNIYRERIINLITSVIKNEIIESSPHAVSVSERHRSGLIRARAAAAAAVRELERAGWAASVPASENLREALDEIGILTGRIYTRELLESIFSRFCVGK